MTENNPVGERSDEEVRGAIVVGLVPGQDPRVCREAARLAQLLGTSVVVGTADASRYATFEDPTGMAAGASIDLALTASDADYEQVELETTQALVGAGVRWTMRRMTGDPAQALADLADAVDAPLIVVGTRKPGIGETLREFFNGSVAARLSHKQNRSVLIVPNGPNPHGRETHAGTV